MREDFIIIQNDKEYDEVLALFFDKEYPNLDFNEKYKVRFRKAIPFSLKYNMSIVDTRVGKISSEGEVISKEYDIENSIIIDNDKTYILSLLERENILLLEKKKVNVFFDKNLLDELELNNSDKSDENDEYININKNLYKLLLLNLKS